MTILKELVIKHTTAQKKRIDDLTEKAPIIDVIPFHPSSHELQHVEEHFESITGAGFVNINDVLTEMAITSELVTRDLAILGGQMWVPQDTVMKVAGSANAYFSGKMSLIMKDAGQASEVAILYDYIRQYCIDNSLHVLAGGDSNAGYTMLFVRFEEGVCGGLYSPGAFNKQKLIKLESLNGGNLSTIPTGHTYAGVNGFGIQVKGYFGFQIASDRNVAAIVNIDSGDIPTEIEMDAALADIRMDENTYIFCHQKCLNLIRSYKGGKLQFHPNDNDYRRSFSSWEGVPFITSYNFYDGTESNVA